MDIIIIMFFLQAKHWYADFWIQTYAQTVRKGIYRDWVGISHTVDHVIGTLLGLLIAGLFVKLSPLLILLCGVLDMIIHYHVDWMKVRFGTKDITTAKYWREFGVDQFAHQLTYILFIYILITY